MVRREVDFGLNDGEIFIRYQGEVIGGPKYEGAIEVSGDLAALTREAQAAG